MMIRIIYCCHIAVIAVVFVRYLLFLLWLITHDGSMVLLYIWWHGSHQEKNSHVSSNIPAPWILWVLDGYFQMDLVALTYNILQCRKSVDLKGFNGVMDSCGRMKLCQLKIHPCLPRFSRNWTCNMGSRLQENWRIYNSSFVSEYGWIWFNIASSTWRLPFFV